jgi:lipopolysaccharide export system permease protein
MYLLERYIFRRIFASFIITLAALSATVWLSQALRQFDLITARGQTIVTFLSLTGLLIPTLVMLVAPIALLIAVLYVLNTMNGDSELAIINGSGAPQGIIVRPVLWIGAIVTFAVAAISLYVAPMTQQMTRDMLIRINSDIVTSVLREGSFVGLTQGLTIHVKGRGRDGSLDGIFVADEREPEQTVTYLARRGAVLDNPIGSFLIMENGVIQRENARDGSISLVEFQSYAFDLSQLTKAGGTASYSPTERPTSELVNPDPNDPLYQRYPERFRSELHDRLSAPLYALVFALVPLAFFGQARTSRQGRGAAITATVLTAIGVRALAFVLVGMAATSPVWLPYLYAVPLITAAISLLIGFAVLRPRLPRWLIALYDIATAPITSRIQRSAARRA